MPNESVLSRRDFISVTALAATGLRAARPDADDAGRLLYVGTYTDDGRSAGIYAVRMDAATGALRLVGPAASAKNPSFLASARGGRYLYAVNEVGEFGGAASGAVSAFARAPAGDGLSLIDQQSSSGAAPCYVTADRTGRFLLVANYEGGSVSVLPVRADGGVGAATATVRHAGKGADPERQSGPHAHCIVADPANRFVLAVDLGLDRVITYAFDARAGTLSRAVGHASTAPGAGPRHLAFHPNGRVVYVVNELASTVTAFRYDAGKGSLAELQTLPALGERSPVPNVPADIHVHPSGRFLYLSNRGHDSIAVFAIAAATGRLRPVEVVSTGGKWPRNFALDPSARFLLVANQRSDTIVGYRVDPSTGRLAATGHRVEVPAPACVRFV